MQVFFIEKTQKITFFKNIFKKVEINEDKIFLNCKCKNINKKIKIVKNIRKKLKTNINHLILSNNLKNDSEFKNLLYSNGFYIIDEKSLNKPLLEKIVQNICKKNQIQPKETQISIVVNNVDNFIINLIEKLSKKFKIVNVVTNNTNYLKKLKEKLWEEEGIIITVTNNKKRGLAKSNIIINIDFSEEMINNYYIFENAILINIEERAKIKKKRFNGKIINEYKIKLKENSSIAKDLMQDKYKNFEIKDLAGIYVLNKPEELENIIIC